MSGAMQAARWGVYAVRLVLYLAYGLAAFFSKPGSRLIVPALASVAVYADRLPVEIAIGRIAWAVNNARLWPVLGVALAVCVGVALFPYARGLLIGFAALRIVLRVTLLMLLLAVLAVLCGFLPVFPFVAVAYRVYSGWTLPGVILTLCLLLALCVYLTLSRLLTVLLGAFPTMTRPMPPLKRLKATGQAVKPVRVRLAVPSIG